MNNEIGTWDVETISRMLRERSAFHSDAAQSLKRSIVDICKFSDALSFLGIKWAPSRHRISIFECYPPESVSPLIQGGGQQNGFRSGTLPLPLCVGAGKACQILTEIEVVERRQTVSQIRDYFYAGLLDLKSNIVLNGPPLVDRHVGNLNISFTGVDATELLMSLQPNVCASTGSACSSGIIEDSRSYSAWFGQ